MKKVFSSLIFILNLLCFNTYVYSSSYLENNKEYSFLSLFGYLFGIIIIILIVIFLPRILFTKLSKTVNNRKIKIIDFINISGIKLILTEIHGKYYVLAFNNNNIIVVDIIETIESLDSIDNSKYENYYNKKYLEKIIKKISSLKG